MPNIEMVIGIVQEKSHLSVRPKGYLMLFHMVYLHPDGTALTYDL